MYKALIVEDEQYLCKLIADQLETLGFEVDLTYDAEAAMEKMKEAEYKLVISDIRLPELNGLEMMETVLEEQEDRPTFLIFSGFSDYTPQEIKEKGASGFYEKPEGIFPLMAEVERIISEVK